MGRLRIVNDYLRMSDPDLIAKASNINSSMTGNSLFADTTADVAVLNTALANFDAAVIAADTRDKVKVAVKNNLKEDLKVVLRKISSMVTHAAPQDDKAVWLSSGFTISGYNNGTVTMGVPENFTVEVGKEPGQVTLRCGRVIGANVYLFLYAPMGTAPDTWQLAFSENREITLNGLALLQQYSFRVVTAGAKGLYQYSELIVKTVV